MGKKSLWWQFLKAAPVIILTLLITLVFSRAGVLRQLETTALDTQLRLHNISDKESDIVIVKITDDDYKKLFQDKSPLSPTALKQLIGAVALGKPKVIGVDIDTSTPQFLELQPEASWPPIIWARTAAYSRIENRFHLFDVLGGRSPGPVSGMVMMKEDSDGAVRRYSRQYNTSEGEVRSLPWMLATQFDPKRVGSSAGAEEDLFIRYAGYERESQFIHVDASKIIDFAKEPSWPDNDLVRNKIVLVGGAYNASDEHDTPLGWMLGVEVLAHTTQTELQGGGIRPAPRGAVIFLQLFDGVLLLLLFQQVRLSKALLLSLIAIPVLSVVCSFVAFRSVAFWAYFAPILIAVLGQQLYDQARDYRKKLIKNLSERVHIKPGEKGRESAASTARPAESKKRGGLKRRLARLGRKKRQAPSKESGPDNP